MAVCRRVVARSVGLYQNALPKIIPSLTRTFITQSSCCKSVLKSTATPVNQHKRYLHTSPERSITGQEAPSAQAYIKSGVISGKKDLVDVKKVIVIGSGGLSIGQAGEFDYSGAYNTGR